MAETTKEQVLEPAPAAPAKPGISMPKQVLIALALGILAGIVFGELTGSLKIIGDIYIGLLQMMVLPYIIISLINGIGKLTLHQAQQMAKYAVLVLLMLWVIAAITVLVLPLALPPLESASFFSASLVESAKPIKLVDIFIPKNVFNSLANNQVPAVVVFCIALGISLITSKNKEHVSTFFDVLGDAVMRVIKFVVKLTPIGVFVMTAAAAGTMTFEEIGRLQGYFIIYTIAVLLLGFWILPGLIVSLTPFKYKHVISIAWSAIILAFAAAKVLVALPLIIESIKELFERYESDNKEAVAVAEVLVPISYPFPNTGKLLSLVFIPFTAWFVGSPMGLADYPAFYVSGVLSYFGNVAVAMPFLLDLMHLPADMFQLFLLTGVYCGRLSDGLGAMDMFAFATLVACASGGMLKVQWRRLILIMAGAVIVGGVAIGGVRLYLESIFEGGYSKDELVAAMQLPRHTVDSVVVDAEPNPKPLEASQSYLDRIAERGVIRIGFDPDRLPFSYFNASGDLVGYDVEMADHLADDLGVSIEFVPFDFDTLEQQLADDHFDIAMAGVPGSSTRSAVMRFSEPYMMVNLALAVPDFRDVEFATLASIRELEDVVIGVHRDLLGRSGMEAEDVSFDLLPEANLKVVDSYREFFEQTGTGEGVDAMVVTAEGGSAWTLLYPGFQVVIPWEVAAALPLVYPFAGRDDAPFDEFLDHWVLLIQHDGSSERAYNYWILGEGAEKSQPRWSVVRNVLGWVD
jgi:Na+/H+-dicarboxylate symporter/ABC-type amino acid transport substrate-binding protein